MSLSTPQDMGSAVTNAVISAAERLCLSPQIRAAILGVSEATVWRLNIRKVTLEPATKSFELAILLVRLFRSLDTIVGGDDAVAASWVISPNTALGGRPIDILQTPGGLSCVVAYLESRTLSPGSL
jgi:uncharacterized protein (DUF2384 family)